MQTPRPRSYWKGFNLFRSDVAILMVTAELQYGAKAKNSCKNSWQRVEFKSKTEQYDLCFSNPNIEEISLP